MGGGGSINPFLLEKSRMFVECRLPIWEENIFRQLLENSRNIEQLLGIFSPKDIRQMAKTQNGLYLAILTQSVNTY